MTTPEPGIQAASEELMQELMACVVTIGFLLETLMDLPADMLPGEDGAEAIRELLTSSTYGEVALVGEDACRAATALIAKVVDRMADDVNATAQMAEATDRRPC